MSDLPSGLAATPETNEEVCRFLMSSGWVAKQTGRIKHAAFLPAPDHDTSVYRIAKLDAFRIWKIADENLRKRCEHGAAKISVETLTKQSLVLFPHEPPLRHANIRGWPNDSDPQEQKRKRMHIAKELAEVAEYIPRLDSAPGL